MFSTNRIRSISSVKKALLRDLQTPSGLDTSKTKLQTEKLSDMSLKKLEGDLRNSSRKRHRISSKIETERIIKSRSDFEYQIRQSERDFRRLD